MASFSFNQSRLITKIPRAPTALSLATSASASAASVSSLSSTRAGAGAGAGAGAAPLALKPRTSPLSLKLATPPLPPTADSLPNTHPTTHPNLSHILANQHRSSKPISLSSADATATTRLSTHQAQQQARPNYLYRLHDLKVLPTGASLGAYVTGVSLSTAYPLPEEIIREIRVALRHHHMLIFPRQALSEQHMLRLTSYFGQPHHHHHHHHHHFSSSSPSNSLASRGSPEAKGSSSISGVSYLLERGSSFIPFHSDWSFTENPAMVTIFHCLQAPRTGGETKFANIIQAYDSLPERLKHDLQFHTAIHRHPKPKNHFLSPSPPPTSASASPSPSSPPLPVSHPVFPVHPLTHQRTLYVSPYFTTRINGVSEGESEQYLKELFEHATRMDHTYTHFWAAGDVVVCDNRATMHSKEASSETEPRNMMRSFTLGGRPSSF